MRPTNCDVAVIGAGPSGAWAAYCLASAGARVTIFDPSHPREKPCGGGITGRALALVGDSLHGTHTPISVITRARFTDAVRGTSASIALPTDGLSDSALVVSSRAAFDHALLIAACNAGVTLVDRRVTHLAADRTGVDIHTGADRYRARILIGADGANSLARRRLSRPFPRAALSIGTGYFAHGITSDEIVVELVPDPPGYIWSFPRPDHLAVGICAQADSRLTADDLRRRTAKWIADTGIAPDAQLEPYSWPIPSLRVDDLRRLELAGANWCLIGDAAGLVDPITREGIFFGLLSGAWAADAILAGDLTKYASRVTRVIVPELIRAARFKVGFFRPTFISLLVHALRHSMRVREVMVDLVAGRQSYAGLKRRLLKTMEWRLACQLIVSARDSHRAREPGHQGGQRSRR